MAVEKNDAASPRRSGGARSWAAVAAPTKNPASPSPVTRRRRMRNHTAWTSPSGMIETAAMAAPPTAIVRRPTRSPRRPTVGRTMAADTAKAPMTSPTSSPLPFRLSST